MVITATCGHLVTTQENLHVVNVKVDCDGQPGVATVALCANCRWVHDRSGVILRGEMGERLWMALPRTVGETW